MLFLDLETYSELDLRMVSLDRYASHASTRILMCAYCVDDGDMQFWQEGDADWEFRVLKSLLMDPPAKIAWNVGFERTLIKHVWKMEISPWADAMVMARYAGLPAGLKDCNRVPFFAGESVTSKETLLINKFCKPGKNGVIHNKETDPEDWAAFCDYCKRDVLDTRLIYKWLLTRFPVPVRVHDAWVLDQKINQRGMPIDLELCWNANQEAARLQVLALRNLAELTGLDNPNSVKQLLAWVTERGYVYNGLGKELVNRFLDDPAVPEGEAKAALRLRLAGAKASVKKLGKILEQVSPDNRLREQYRFYGAHTGRWSGRGAQLQNLKAPRTKEEKALVSVVVGQLERGEEVASLDALSLSLRPIITAPKGKKVVLADFKSVENRVLAWVSGCETMMQVYREGRDPYIDFASRMENIPYEEVSAEMRQIAKPGTLGCGFGLGGGQTVYPCKCVCRMKWNAPKPGVSECPRCKAETETTIPAKTGLWRYAEMMGVDLSKGGTLDGQKEARRQVEEFRTAFAEVCELWYWLEEAYVACCRTKREQTVGVLKIRWADPALRIVLPSGRELMYVNAFGFQDRDDRGFKKITMGFEGVRGKSWMRQTTYGGRLCENVVQAIAADLLMDALLLAEKDVLLEVVGHTHDEIISLACASPDDKTAVERLEGYMSQTPAWAEGLPMAADGYEGRRYAKG